MVQDKSGRIRQGSPEEERALGLHITALAPTSKQLTEASQLAELLTLLGNLTIAASARLRRTVSVLQRLQRSWSVLQCCISDTRILCWKDVKSEWRQPCLNLPAQVMQQAGILVWCLCCSPAHPSDVPRSCSMYKWLLEIIRSSQMLQSRHVPVSS